MKHITLALSLAGLAVLGGTTTKAEASSHGPPASNPPVASRGRMAFGGVGFGIGVGACRPWWGGRCFPVGGCFPCRPFPCRFPCGPVRAGCFPGPRFVR